MTKQNKKTELKIEYIIYVQNRMGMLEPYYVSSNLNLIKKKIQEYVDYGYPLKVYERQVGEWIEIEEPEEFFG